MLLISIYLIKKIDNLVCLFDEIICFFCIKIFVHYCKINNFALSKINKQNVI